MDDDEIDWERLDRFVRGEGTPAELTSLGRWVDANPTRRALADAMRTVGSTGPGPSPQWDATRALRRVERQRGGVRRGTRKLHLTVAPPARRSPAILSALLLAGAAAVILVSSRLSTTRQGERASGAELAVREVVTTRGQRATLTLSDGTRLALSPESRLRIPGDFGQTPGHRELWLDGEAFFAVQHDSTRPFIVDTPHGSAEDLGTEFVVNTYPEVNGMRLAVRAGRVALRAESDSTRAHRRAGERTVAEPVAILDEGDAAHLSAGGAVDVSRGQDVSALFAGVEGTLVLSSTPLRDAIPRLERWYAIRVHVVNRALLSRRISGTFRAESAPEALGVIALALGARTAWNHDEVTLLPSHVRQGEQ